MSFRLHLTFEDEYEAMVNQASNSETYGRAFYTGDNHMFEMYKKPKDGIWYKVKAYKAKQHWVDMYSTMYSDYSFGTTFLGRSGEARSSTESIQPIVNTTNTISFRNGSSITHARHAAEHRTMMEEYNRQAVGIAHSTLMREAERRAAQREEERRRLEEERNRPSFLRRMNPFGRR